MPGTQKFDVVVVGGGPTGSVMAWQLARQGIRVAVVERAHFPREKVCGDFIEPGGLRILDEMGCLPAIEATNPLPITHIQTFVESQAISQGPIAYYESSDAAGSGRNLPTHGLIVPRSEFDTCLLEHAETASATVFQGCSVKAIDRTGSLSSVSVSTSDEQFSLLAPLVVGADGAESLVARCHGIARNNPRHTSISQRAYVDGVTSADGEAALWFDDEIFPGYAWMFPMRDGRANVGVGVLGEACRRHGLSVPQLFRAFIDKLRRHHPGCTRIQLASKPMGGIVKSYSGITRNVFDGGLLIGDAGGFVDPVTSEGITPGMESALIGARTIMQAISTGRFDQEALSSYERDYRAHFDPSMRYLDWCATVMSNRHMREFCLRAMATAYRESITDKQFARVAGASFGGLDLRPSSALVQVFSKITNHIATGSSAMLLDFLGGKSDTSSEFARDMAAWRRGMKESLTADPRWHMAWTADIARKSARIRFTSHNPRLHGIPLQAA